ncbi:PQQ-dependent sugar dehydrogenase [Haloferula sp. BvORR071]|uniref:PQQ-dependent sugar dehydrogenase n=1 Tax=Haloferula sp. BvORR071 TaxID=1396141 RepID=UPI000554D520|nr:PQQ-dependent sugar dehydrogenase [Haloferula sp. BvORR071]
MTSPRFWIFLGLALANSALAAPPTGAITRHVWTGIGGSEVQNLTSIAAFPNSPSQTGTLPSFLAPQDSADDYGQRVFGWVHAPVTGNYRFYIHSDDSSELWLSTSESPDNKRKVAMVNGWGPAGNWTNSPDQTSAIITLQAGRYYYIEALHKEGGGGDNLGVGWTYPGQASITYTPGSNLSTWQNVAPILANDSAYVYTGSSTLIRVMDNDVEPNGKADFNLASMAIQTPPTQGTATITANKSILYTHTGSGTGTDTFTYRIQDQAGLISTATVTMNITDQMRLPLSSARMPSGPPPQALTAINAFPTLPGFEQPLAIITPPGEASRIFVVEKGGDIEVIPNINSPAVSTFLNLDGIVNGRGTESFKTDGEAGLLGLAFHPQYASNRRFFVYYSVTIGANFYQRLSEFACSAGNPNVADPASEKVLLQMLDEWDNHNGGCVQFGNDGYLYVSFGDEGDQNDAGANSQKITKDFWSSMIRIDVNVDPANYGANPNLAPNPHPAIVLDPVSNNPRYKVPANNPWVGATSFNGQPVTPSQVRTEFWAVGLRNPWRFSFDAPTGDLWCGDVGGGSWEEINKITKGGNYEWAYREGITGQGPRWNERPGTWAGGNLPIFAYGHGSGTLQGNSVTGGLIYRGTRLPALTGKYIFGDYSSGNIWSMDPAIGSASVTRLTGEGGIAAFGTDPSNGDVLLADLDGQVRRLVSQAVDTGFPATLTDTGLFADVAALTPASGLVEYSVNLPFWSDNAKKRRWFGMPSLTPKLGFNREGAWTTPEGTIWVKHFDMEMTRGNPATNKRLETRVLVRNAEGSYGVSYRWNAAGTEATLAAEAGEEFDLNISVNGTPTTQRWRIPSRSECMSCHTPQAGHSLSFRTRQLNLPGTIGLQSGNLIQLLSDAGYLDGLNASPATLAKHPAGNDSAYSLEARARAWLDVNCSYCHMAGGTAPANFDVRAQVPLFSTNTVGITPTSGALHPDDKLISLGQEERSVLIHRASARNGYSRMPPLATSVIDPAGVQLLKDWIESMSSSRQSLTAWTAEKLGALPPADQMANADPDGDGRNNQQEFLEHTDPLTADRSSAPGVALQNGDTLQLEFPALPGRGQILQSSPNLADWSDWPFPGNDGLERSGPWQLSLPATDGQRFFRARIEER